MAAIGPATAAALRDHGLMADVIPGEERFYGIMVVTDGAWTPAQGFPQLSPPEENPAITAAYTPEGAAPPAGTP